MASMRMIRMARPTPCIQEEACIDIRLPRIASIMTKNSLPPSRPGIGKIFIIARLIESNAKKVSKVVIPMLRAEAVRLKIPTGPAI